ncbi:alpha/beta fold hydrolase [Streptomyces zagrosensis]|uniref:Pimeloyl-ACP methyl ester carboxylesterase n=1 Tax=Streptomyces zagrosensis TaxID=1042984 RepID=A0A7W9QJW6_9ACTN|nr:alpha/beta hydrolase [Streptomyces zagrosensis]MBB5940357.1 pimeloyl-ACP methyl ester carboxylesterase [Streptomyces zagrosensis]
MLRDTLRESSALVRGRRLRYLDAGGPGHPVLALHGHFGRARAYAALATALAPRYRIIALEQRGHGRSADPAADAGDFTRGAYVADVADFLQGLALGPMPIVGHSVGGLTAFQLAAQRPELVSALVVEEGGAYNRQPHIPHPVLDVRHWPRRAPTLAALRQRIEERGIPDASYFLESAVEYPDGWGFLFDLDAMMTSQQAAIGDWWQDWLGSSCPALLIHGTDSLVLPTSLATEMADRRAGTELRQFHGCGHWVHDDDPAGFANAVAAFLTSLTFQQGAARVRPGTVPHG